MPGGRSITRPVAGCGGHGLSLADIVRQLAAGAGWNCGENSRGRKCGVGQDASREVLPTIQKHPSSTAVGGVNVAEEKGQARVITKEEGSSSASS